MIKKFLAVFLSVSVAVTSCGCWDSRELSNIAVVMGIAVDVCEDEEKGTVTLGVQVAKPIASSGSSGSSGGGSQGESKAYSDFSASGNNVAEIISGITHLSSRRLYSAHNQIVVFGRELAESEGVSQAVDYFLRDNELRYSVLVAVADGKGSETLSATTNFEDLPATELAELIKNQASNSGSATCSLEELAKSGMKDGTTALVPLVKFKESEDDKEKKTYEVIGAAVFRGSKMVGELTEEQTRGALWVRNGVSRAVIETKLDGNVRSAVEVFDCTASVKVEVYGGCEAVANVKCNVYANLAQLSNYKGTINDELAEKIAKSCEEVVKGEIKEAYAASVELGCDVFGFGNKLRTKDYSNWKQCGDRWQELFADIDLNIDVKVRIEDVGDLTAEIPWQKG